MKQLNFTILFTVLMSMVGAKVSAHDFEVVNADGISIYYLKTSDTEVAVSSRSGYKNNYSGNVTIPESVTYNGDTYSVTSIGECAFYACSGLTSVTIPNSVISIELSAFDSSGLTSVTIPNSVTSIGCQAFCQCSGLTSVTIGNSVKYIQGYAFYGCSSLTSVTIPNSVTSIGECAFWECSGLTSVTIGNSVTSIGEFAFHGCSSLRQVTSKISTPFDVEGFEWSDNYNTTLVVPKGTRSAYKKVNGWQFGLILEEGETYAINKTDDQGVCYSLRNADDDGFYYAVTLTGNSDDLKSEIVIPADIDGFPVKTIETILADGAFEGCNNLTSITIPNSVTSIAEGAFYNCSGLKLVISKISKPFDVNAFDTNIGTLVVPKGSRSAYKKVNGWTFDFTYEEGETIYDREPIDAQGIKYELRQSSDDYSFYYAVTGHTDDLKSEIVIPADIDGCPVKIIENRAFEGCSNLTSITIPNSMVTIGDNAFWGCSGLSSFTIPDGVTSIGFAAFDFCSSLSSIKLPKSLVSMGDFVFAACRSLITVTIPDGVTSIGNHAFSGCSLTSVKLPESLTSMGEYVFDGCPLKSIELPNSFTAIPDNLFESIDLEYIKLGNNVKSIGKNAFGCSGSIVVIEIGTSAPPTITNDAFPKLEALSVINVIVPDAAAETVYRKAAVWKEMTFTNQNNVSEVTVDTPGDLSFELITECGMQPVKVVGLKVKGTINAEDFSQILVNMKSLLRLDLSGCDITEIPEGALKGKTQLQELTLPTKLQIIGNYAFQGCPYLTGKLDMPSGVTSIGDYAFEGTNYTSVTLPSKLKTIGSYAFYNLPIKQKIILPDALTSIGDYAFSDTQISGHAEIPDGIKYLGTGAFRNTQIDPVSLPDNPNGITSISQALFQGCTSLDYIYIPRNFTEVSGYAFDGCTNLTYVRMSPDLETLGEYAFQNTQLEYLKVPAKVEILSEGMLKNCKSLESLSLPASLKEVGCDALRGCNALRNLSIEAINPPTVDNSSLIGVNTDLCIISIPTQSYRDYVLAEYWGQFVQMRNDIAVETEGNGEIAFESVVEEEEEVSASRRRAQSVTEEESMTFANNGSSLYVPQNGKVRFIIIPGEGEKLLSATLDGENIMPNIVDGVYTATADKKNAKLVVKFSGTSTPVTITAKSYTIKYGDELPTFEYTSEGAEVEGTPEITCEATKTSSVDTYPIVISKGSVTNNNVTYVNGTLTIEKALLTITAKDYTIMQGEALPEFEATYEGFKNDETAAVLTTQPTITTTATSVSDPGEYDIIVSGAEAQNYDITYANGKLTITEASGILGISVEHPADVYDLQGNKIRSKITSLSGLSKGVYIINGKKVLIK